ncbi:MAG: PQQ-dependent sugar dehydrogenase [Polyangiaceae bacterium]|nr:PQQ-dependent sugar dehydrogenase [Polyangiaceae bacterium]
MRAIVYFALPFLLVPFAACGDDDDAMGNGGSAGVAGKGASGGGSSGAAGKGAAGSSGSAGQGGSAGTGAGASGTAGGSGAAGSAGSAGQGGSGGQPLPGEPTLTRTLLLGGLSHPWDIAFLPGEQRALVTERSGKLSLVDTAGKQTPVEGPTDVLANGEGGLLGLTLDPQFATNRRVYTCFSHAAGGDGVDDTRVVRWRLSDDAARLEQRLDIVTAMPRNPSGRHSGCRLLFGADGFLYVGTGDSAQGANPQDLTSLGGKVLRVTSDGTAAPGNPDVKGKDPRVFTYGHRNIQGLALQPGTGRVYSGEHGPDVDDEINFVQAGKNYGWNPVPGYNETVPMTDLGAFPDAVSAAWSSGDPTRALSGITFLAHPSWRDWTGALVGAELKFRRLRVLKLSADGTTSTELKELFVDQAVRLRTVVLGPDGALYVATDNKPGGDEIWRVVAQ